MRKVLCLIAVLVLMSVPVYAGVELSAGVTLSDRVLFETPNDQENSIDLGIALRSEGTTQFYGSADASFNRNYDKIAYEYTAGVEHYVNDNVSNDTRYSVDSTRERNQVNTLVSKVKLNL